MSYSNQWLVISSNQWLVFCSKIKSHSVSEWQGHLLSCSGQLKRIDPNFCVVGSCIYNRQNKFNIWSHTIFSGIRVYYYWKFTITMQCHFQSCLREAWKNIFWDSILFLTERTHILKRWKKKTSGSLTLKARGVVFLWHSLRWRQKTGKTAWTSPLKRCQTDQFEIMSLCADWRANRNEISCGSLQKT